MVRFKALSSIVGIVGILSFVGMAQPVISGVGDFLNVNQNIFLLSCPAAGVKEGVSKARALLARDTLVVIRSDMYFWRTTAWDSISSMPSFYKYDERGRVVEELFSQSSMRVIYEYNAIGTLAVIQTRDTTLHVWNNYMTTYTVRTPVADSVFMEILFHWNTLTSDWDTSKMLGVLIQDSTSSNYSHAVITFKNWDTLSHTWAAASSYLGKSTYTNNNGQTTEIAFQTKDTISGLWKNYTKTLYVFNSDGTTQSAVAQTWDSTANSWKNNYKSIYTYASISVGVTNKTTPFLPKATLSAYWQNGTIRIIGSNNKSIKDVALFNGTGRCITKLSSNQSVFDFNPSLRVAGNSIYFLKIRTSSGEQIIKVNGIK